MISINLKDSGNNDVRKDPLDFSKLEISILNKRLKSICSEQLEIVESLLPPLSMDFHLSCEVQINFYFKLVLVILSQYTWHVFTLEEMTTFLEIEQHKLSVKIIT